MDTQANAENRPETAGVASGASGSHGIEGLFASLLAALKSAKRYRVFDTDYGVEGDAYPVQECESDANGDWVLWSDLEEIIRTHANAERTNPGGVAP